LVVRRISRCIVGATISPGREPVKSRLALACRADVTVYYTVAGKWVRAPGGDLGRRSMSNAPTARDRAQGDAQHQCSASEGHPHANRNVCHSCGWRRRFRGQRRVGRQWVELSRGRSRGCGDRRACPGWDRRWCQRERRCRQRRSTSDRHDTWRSQHRLSHHFYRRRRCRR
jgi:hypothetical protein